LTIEKLSHASGLELQAYRSEHVAERVRRALEREDAQTPAELARVIAHDVAARSRFRRSIAISVSGLFRDPAQFELLERELLPPLLARGGRLKVWSAGCADGSELYSIGQLLARLGVINRAFLLGSDLLDENLEAARRGVYGGISIDPELKTHVRWERRDLVREGAPLGRWQLVLCRNLAIYLAPHARTALHETLAGALAADGVLLLGRSERLSDPAGLGLEAVAPHAYRKTA
jgi:chemotaxis protein methyltransferase CheR